MRLETFISSIKNFDELAAKAEEIFAGKDKTNYYSITACHPDDDLGAEVLCPLSDADIRLLKELQAKDELDVDLYELIEGTPLKKKISEMIPDDTIPTEIDLAPKRSYSISASFTDKNGKLTTIRYKFSFTDAQYKALLIWALSGHTSFDEIREIDPELYSSLHGRISIDLPFIDFSIIIDELIEDTRDIHF